MARLAQLFVHRIAAAQIGVQNLIWSGELQKLLLGASETTHFFPS